MKVVGVDGDKLALRGQWLASPGRTRISSVVTHVTGDTTNIVTAGADGTVRVWGLERTERGVSTQLAASFTCEVSQTVSQRCTALLACTHTWHAWNLRTRCFRYRHNAPLWWRLGTCCSPAMRSARCTAWRSGRRRSYHNHSLPSHRPSTWRSCRKPHLAWRLPKRWVRDHESTITACRTCRWARSIRELVGRDVAEHTDRPGGQLRGVPNWRRARTPFTLCEQRGSSRSRVCRWD